MDASDPRRYLWDNITELMKPQKATIDAVCARTGVPRGNVQRMKQGEALPSLDTIQRTAAAFGLHERAANVTVRFRPQKCTASG